MAIIIQKVLFEKLARHPEWREFRDSFEALTGSRIQLLEGKEGRNRSRMAVTIEVHRVQVGFLEVTEPPGDRRLERAWRCLMGMAAERFAGLLADSNINDHQRLPQTILRTCRWIRNKALLQEVSLGEAAEHCGLSPSHLSRLFHKSTGMTYQDYVTRFRLEHACNLLRTTDRPVTEIAFESGFQSISQFHRSFKAVYAERPTEYRRRREA